MYLWVFLGFVSDSISMADGPMTIDPCFKIRVILSDNDIRKMTLPGVTHPSILELHEKVQAAFGLVGDFKLHYFDPDFQEFCNLSSDEDIFNKGTVKVIYTAIPESDSDDLTNSIYDDLLNSTQNSNSSCKTTSLKFDDSASVLSSSDTSVLSTLAGSETDIEQSQRTCPWPEHFPIPRFSYDTELKLSKGNINYGHDKTLMNPVGVKSDILEKIAETIFQYKAYPTDLQFCSVAQALVTKYPCLKEMGSVTGWYGWKTSLKFKMGNYRTKLRNVGCPELTVNSCKRKAGNEQAKTAKNIKKPRRAEVNYLPDYPCNETAATLESERLTLLEDTKKKGNEKEVNDKMARTFPHRRQEVVLQKPMVVDFKERWPVLFTNSQVRNFFSK
jgi:hypothetical protein